MNSERLHHPLVAHLAAFGSTLALGCVIAFAYTDADAQQAPKTSAKPQATSSQPTPAQATPAPPRRDAATKPADRREARRAKRRAMTLGMQLQPAKDEKGLLVSTVEENSLAARAGVQQNDRIVSVDGRTFVSARQMDAYLASQAGRRIPIIIDRSGQQSTLFITPTQMAADTAWLGVFLEEGDANAKGARITHVYPSGPAARAGLHEGDTITQIDSQPIENPSELVTVVQESEPQAQAQFVIMRNDKEMKLPVTFGSREHFVPPTEYQAGYGPAANGQGGYPNTYAPNGAADNAQYGSPNNDYENVPPHAMRLEHDRRVAEQHQRIEEEIRELREEIRQLREELKKK